MLCILSLGGLCDQPRGHRNKPHYSPTHEAAYQAVNNQLNRLKKPGPIQPQPSW